MSTRSNEITDSPFAENRRREILGILLLALAIFLIASLFSSMIGGENWMGLLGRGLAYAIYSLCGLASIFLVYGLLLLALRSLRKAPFRLSLFGTLGFAGILFFSSMIFHLLFSHPPGSSSNFLPFRGKLSQISAGGLLGSYAIEVLLPLIGMAGTILSCLTGLLISTMVATSFTSHLFLEGAKAILLQGKVVAKRTWQALWPKEESSPAETEADLNSDRMDAKLHDPESRWSSEPVIAPRQLLNEKPSMTPMQSKESILRESEIKQESQTAALTPEATEPKVVPRPTVQTFREDEDELSPSKQEYIKIGNKAYQFPPLESLDYKEPHTAEIDRKAMLELAQRLEKSLADYQVKGRVSQIHPGPVVTMYEFVPSPGTKLSKITSLASDLAMALEALRVRIVAPIPGKAAVGIEVPNGERETVYVKEILADESFAQAKSRLTLALGKDIAGLPVSVDLAKMPHLLIAGTTGSGKSVAVNVMISSILFRASPDDVKMIMIDPKMLELSIYEGIPHLLLPVVTDPKKANLALKWAVDEMERRYELISKSGVRDIVGYNQKMEELLAQESPSSEIVTEEIQRLEDDPEDESLDSLHAMEGEQIPLHLMKERPRKLPFIVVLIDEFADLMMVSSKEVEVSVARIAQKARAAGIHLILATQRPSVDVITGLIKANFPSRIAFQVASRIDSRTILDTQGAENLLGMGDMLFTDRGQALRRIHGALITDKEVHKLVEHLKKQGRPIYNMEILRPREEEDAEVEEEFADEMYDQAVRVVVESRQASISMVQRRLRIGYNRAARMVERMEKEGIVSGADGAKGREVLVQNH